MQRVLSAGFCFRAAYLATRIPCDTCTYGAERSDHVDSFVRSFVPWRGEVEEEGRLARTFRDGFFALVSSPRLPVWWLVSTALHRWNVGERPTRGANIFPFYLTVLDTPRDVPFLVFSSLLAPLLPPWIIVSTLDRERQRYGGPSRWSLRD